MALILKNEKIAQHIYWIQIEGKYEGNPGQFYMIKAGEYPLLRRPISIFSIEEKSISFIYQVVGEGTELISKMIPGQTLDIKGPYGNGFPEVAGKIALVGGGVGIPPLYETCKRLKQNEKVSLVDMYLGFSGEMFLKELWQKSCDNFIYNVGGFITDYIDVSKYDVVLTCGPDIMMEKLTKACQEKGVKIYVSKESRMGCGIGACLACTCKTKAGNKKVCQDGPVFLGEEVYYG